MILLRIVIVLNYEQKDLLYNMYFGIYCIKYQRDISASVILVAILTLFYYCDKILWQIQCVGGKGFVCADGSRIISVL